MIQGAHSEDDPVMEDMIIVRSDNVRSFAPETGI